MTALQLLAGLAFLAVGGEALVRGASRLARLFGISPLVIGLTVVAFETSTPELVVSLYASHRGNPDIAVANVVGSNIFNVLFILGLCAVIRALVVAPQILRQDVPLLIALSLTLWVMTLDGKIELLEGLLLLALFTGLRPRAAPDAHQRSRRTLLPARFFRKSMDPLDRGARRVPCPCGSSGSAAWHRPVLSV